jgi:UDP-3-O-[3-hydroxymyristoyl] glucosamine N-acyltransferase
MCYDFSCIINRFSGMDIHIPFAELEELFPDAEKRGLARPVIKGIASLEEAGPDDLTFVSSVRFAPKLQACRAGVVFIPTGMDAVPAQGQVFIVTADPSLALARICERVELVLRPRPMPGVHPSACVDPSAQISLLAHVGPGCIVGPLAVIDEGTILESNIHIGRAVRIGKDCHIQPGVIVTDYCEIGQRVRIQPGAIIGGDGFGYIQVGKLPDLIHYKVPQIGIVVIEDDVEIGAGTCIDRARFGKTLIGQGTKIDNLVQIAHNVKIGRRCIICSQVGISGSTTIGDYVVMWGQVGTVGHIEIGDGAFIGGQAGVTSNIKAGEKVTGTPARSMFDQRKIDALALKLPELFRRVDVIETRLPSASSEQKQ